METNLLNRINKLKQDLTQVATPTVNKSEDLAAYLSQSYKNPTPEVQATPSQHLKQLLEEKSSRIQELEEEVAYLRDALKSKEQDLISKYESAIESIKSNCDGLIEYYESQMERFKMFSENKDLEELLETVKNLDQENNKLKAEGKALQSSWKKEKSALEQEISTFKERKNFEGEELDELKGIKDKLKREIANLQRSKNEEFNGMVEDYEEKYSKAVRIAEMWKTRFDQLAFKFFTFLRSLKIEMFEVKNEILTNFEDAITCASSMISRLYKKSKMVRD